MGDLVVPTSFGLLQTMRRRIGANGSKRSMTGGECPRTESNVMEEMFDYDIFLSFAVADETIVRPIWQELCLSGLRVFWSDATLKQRLGESWFDNIESSLERSRHFVLVVSPSSMASEWVRREYKAFYNHCYQAGVRRL